MRVRAFSAFPVPAVAAFAVACAGTFGAPAPPDRPEEPLDAVIPPDFDELPLLDLEWQSSDPDLGVLRGILPNGEVVGGRVLIRELQRDTGEVDTGVTERGFEEGADVFSPFPERWPTRTNNVLNPTRSSRVDLTLGTETGRILECKLMLNDADRGFLGGAKGVCIDPDGTRFRTRVGGRA